MFEVVAVPAGGKTRLEARTSVCRDDGEFPSQRPVTRSFGVFFDMRLNKRLSKQTWGWWFETASRLGFWQLVLNYEKNYNYILLFLWGITAFYARTAYVKIHNYITAKF